MPFDGLLSNANYEVETVHLCIDAQKRFLEQLSPERAASFPAELRRFADHIEPAIPTIWIVSGSATFWPYPASATRPDPNKRLSDAAVRCLSSSPASVDIIKDYKDASIVAFDANPFGFYHTGLAVEALQQAKIVCVGIPPNISNPKEMREHLEPEIIRLLKDAEAKAVPKSESIRLEGGGYRTVNDDDSYTDYFDDGGHATTMKYNANRRLDGGVDEHGRLQPAIIERVSGSNTLWRYCYYSDGQKAVNQFGIHEVWLSCTEKYPIYMDVTGREVLPQRIREAASDSTPEPVDAFFMSKHFECQGDYSIVGKESDQWPDMVYINGNFIASYSNIENWKREWRVNGAVDLSHSSFTRFEPGTYFCSDLNVSDTPCLLLPKDICPYGNVVARNTPDLKTILGEDVFFSKNLDLTGSGIMIMAAGIEIGRDFIVSDTKEFKWSPPELRVGGNFIACNSMLETIHEDTYVGGILDLSGSRVTHLPLSTFVGEKIIGHDKKIWNMAKNPAETLRVFNAYYAEIDLPPLPRREPKFKVRQPVVA